MTTQHTPGPWRTIEQVGGRTVLVMTNRHTPDTSIASVIGDDKEPNARLIAAAPDLLAALRQIRDQYTALDEFDVRRIANEAIAKAEGV